MADDIIKEGVLIAFFEFFKKEGIILENGIYTYNGEQKILRDNLGKIIEIREKLQEEQIWGLHKETPKIIDDICTIIHLLRLHGLGVDNVDKTVLVSLIKACTAIAAKGHTLQQKQPT